MSILNVNQIQPVGSGQTITISASDITASSATITASSVTATTVTSSSTSTFSSGLNVTGGAVGIITDSPIAERLDIRTSDLTNIHQSLSEQHRGVFIGGDSDTVVQIASNNSGSVGAGVVLTNMESSADGRHWVMQHGATSESNKFTLGYVTTSSDRATNLMTSAKGSGADLTITTNGNVGIATNNPSRKLHVNSGSTDTAALFYSSDAGCYINYQDSTSGAGSGVNIGCVGDDIRFGSGAGGEFGRITSDGYFTMSAQPAAMVYKTGTAQLITANAIYNYDATAISQGGMTINASRNRITVPVAGKYMISAASSGSVSTASAGDGWRLQLLRDGAVYGNTYLYPIETTGSEVGQEFSLQFSIVVNAAADDYFEVQLENVGSARATMNYGYFSIYLLG
jgi:hypothetical protein